MDLINKTSEWRQGGKINKTHNKNNNNKMKKKKITL